MHLHKRVKCLLPNVAGTDLCGLSVSALQGSDAAFCVIDGCYGWSNKAEQAILEHDEIIRFARLCAAAGIPHLSILSSVWARSNSIFAFARLQGEIVEAQ
eukprot:g6497.t1